MIYLYLIISTAIYSGLISWKFFQAAGRKPWEAFVPLLNYWVLLKITGRPKWWIILFFIPVVNNVMTIVIIYEFLHVFNYRKISYSVIAVLTGGLYIGYLNYTQDLTYVARDDKGIKKHIPSTVNAIFFAIVAATLIRSTTFESYTIPTGSMEESLLVGDFLFVSKMHYGIRLPMTPFTIPLLHNNIIADDPRTPQNELVKSYSELIELPYIRLPRFTSVQVNDPVVFNYPADQFHDPIDKRENYVKRCVGTPGDSIKMVDRIFFINGVPNELPDRARRQHSYWVEFNTGQWPSRNQLEERYNIDVDVSSIGALQISPDVKGQSDQKLRVIIPDDRLEEFKQIPGLASIEPYSDAVSNVDSLSHTEREYLLSFFPNQGEIVEELGSYIPWTFDQFPSTWVPAKGATIELTPDSYRRYKHIIENYEGHDISYSNGVFTMDGAEVTTYTFADNYYWMMGDNRHNSADSRAWGFVPETHIVGKPVFIWMSINNRESGFDMLRTERIFTTVNGSGDRFPWFWPVMIGIVLYSVGSRYYKKKKAA